MKPMSKDELVTALEQRFETIKNIILIRPRVCMALVKFRLEYPSDDTMIAILPAFHNNKTISIKLELSTETDATVFVSDVKRTFVKITLRDIKGANLYETWFVYKTGSLGISASISYIDSHISIQDDDKALPYFDMVLNLLQILL